MGDVISPNIVVCIDPNLSVQIIIFQKNRFRCIRIATIANTFFRIFERCFATCMLSMQSAIDDFIFCYIAMRDTVQRRNFVQQRFSAANDLRPAHRIIGTRR